MKLIRSIGFAWNGCKACFHTQNNFRIHIIVGSLALLLGAVLHISNGEWIALILCIGSVLILEIINTAIEKLCDLVEKDHHPEIKFIKDVAAGAVLISALVSICIVVINYIPWLIPLLKSLLNI